VSAPLSVAVSGLSAALVGDIELQLGPAGARLVGYWVPFCHAKTIRHMSPVLV